MAVNFQNSFNARNLDPKEIAKNFIYSQSFDVLKNKCHTVILGARGCGKTTLMKMLTLPALYNWDYIGAHKFIEDIPFYAIYIPTDISWLYKDFALNDTKIDKKIIDLVSKFSVNTNIFESVCDTFLNVITHEFNNDDSLLDAEISLSLILIDLLKLDFDIAPRLESIKENLRYRRNIINQNLSKLIYNNNYDFEYFDFLHLNYIDVLPLILDHFKRIFEPKKNSWALCFDELEFAPIWLKKQLYTLLRSTDQRILFKLSSSPILPKEVDEVLKGDAGASLGNDFEIIKMWDTNSQSSNEFSKKLIDSLLKKKNIRVRAKDYFGSNFRYLDGLETYTTDSEYLSQIKSLATKDISFREYLINKNIDPQNPIPTDKVQLASVFRKIKPIVYYRNYFIKDNTSTKISYSINKKYIELYSGYEVLIGITDGNPRWLIGLINSILNRSDLHKADTNIQYDEVERTSNRFINFINNTPYHKQGSKISIIEFIERVGDFFKESLLGKVFNPEPYSSFTYDSNIMDFTEIIEKGLLQGAFILLDEGDENFDFELNNKRFRLSYMYSHQFKLPLRTGKEIKVDKIISDNITVPNLFNYDEN